MTVEMSTTFYDQMLDIVDRQSWVIKELRALMEETADLHHEHVCHNCWATDVLHNCFNLGLCVECRKPFPCPTYLLLVKEMEK